MSGKYEFSTQVCINFGHFRRLRHELEIKLIFEEKIKNNFSKILKNYPSERSEENSEPQNSERSNSERCTTVKEILCNIPSMNATDSG